MNLDVSCTYKLTNIILKPDLKLASKLGNYTRLNL